jgi:hypothetical protein
MEDQNNAINVERRCFPQINFVDKFVHAEMLNITRSYWGLNKPSQQNKHKQISLAKSSLCILHIS